MYADPQLAKLIEKFNAEGPKKLQNRYYIGDPMTIAESQLPICFIVKDTVTISPHTNAENEDATAVVLNVVNKFTPELNNKSFTHAGTSGLYELCEARNSDYSLQENTLAYVLRKYEVLHGENDLYIDLGGDTVIEYVISPPTRRGMFSAEALIRFTISSINPNPALDV